MLLFFVDHIYSHGGIKNENKLDSFSIYKSNASFLKVINEEFKKLKKKSLDTVLLFYKDAGSTYKYSVVWERKKNIYYGKKVFEDLKNSKIKITKLSSSIIKQFNNSLIYNTVRSDSIWRIGYGQMLSNDFLFYFKFSFQNKESLYWLYWSEINWFCDKQYDFSFLKKIYP